MVTGCYAQRAPEEIAALPGVSGWSAIRTRTRIPIWSPARHYHGEIRIGDIFEQRDFLSAPVRRRRGRPHAPNLKIQDGCNNRCSFCIIPYVRGRSRSAPPDRDRAGAPLSREISRSGPQRDQPGPLGPRAREGAMRLADLVRASAR